MRFVERFAEFAGLPKELLCGFTGVNIVSAAEISVENHKGLISFSDEEIIFITKNGKCIVKGLKLSIKEISRDELKICGKIQNVAFL